MGNTININLLESIGACKPHCNILRTIYPDGELVFDMAHLPEVLAKKVQVFWAVMLLTRDAQVELALKWYDRGLDAVSPSWKTSLRALLTTPNAEAASTQLGDRLADRRATPATDMAATATAGVGYAAAALAGKFAETPVDLARIMAGLVVLSQWASQASSIAEGKTMDAVLDELRADVWAAVEAHGVTLPPA